MRNIIIYHQIKSWNRNTIDNKNKSISLFNKFRKGAYNFLEPENNNIITILYEFLIVVTILLAVIPLMIMSPNNPVERDYVNSIGVISTTLLFVDFLVRWTFADYSLNKGKKSFLLYIVSIPTLVDLFSLSATFFVGSSVFLSLRLIRVLRIFNATSGYRLLVNGIKRENKTLKMLAGVLLAIMFVGALLVFNVEGPNVEDTTQWNKQIGTFGDAIWLIFVTLTTIGFGDVTPQTDVGKIVISSISVVSLISTALLTGVVLMGFTEEMNSQKKQENEKLDLSKKYKKIEKMISITQDKTTIDNLMLEQTKIIDRVHEINNQTRYVHQNDHLHDLDEELQKMFSKKHHNVIDLKYEKELFLKFLSKRKDKKLHKKAYKSVQKDKYQEYKKKNS